MCFHIVLLYKDWGFTIGRDLSIPNRGQINSFMPVKSCSHSSRPPISVRADTGMRCYAALFNQKPCQSLWGVGGGEWWALKCEKSLWAWRIKVKKHPVLLQENTTSATLVCPAAAAERLGTLSVGSCQVGWARIKISVLQLPFRGLLIWKKIYI